MRSGISASAYVYLPPQYFWPASAGRTFGVVVVISDHVMTAGDPYSAASLAVTAAAETAAGRAKPAIYVMLGASVAGSGIAAASTCPAGRRPPPSSRRTFRPRSSRPIGPARPRPAGPRSATRAAATAPCRSPWRTRTGSRWPRRRSRVTARHPVRRACGRAHPAGGCRAEARRSATRATWAGGWRTCHPRRSRCASCGARRPARRGRAGAGAARAFLSLMQAPTHVTQLTLAAGPRPLAQAIDRITAELTAGGRP